VSSSLDKIYNTYACSTLISFKTLYVRSITFFHLSHHNVVGSRYDDQRLNVRLVNQVNKSGFAFQSSREDAAPSNVTFTAPSSVAIAAPFGDEGAFQVLELYSSPSRPGFSNHVGRMVVVKGRTGGMPNLLKQFTLPFPKWINHIMSSFFLNQVSLFPVIVVYFLLSNIRTLTLTCCVRACRMLSFFTIKNDTWPRRVNTRLCVTTQIM
jgi:hypothetical protein